MNLSDIKNKNIVIWGAGREGLAAATFIHAKLPKQEIIFVDEGHAIHPDYQIIHDSALIYDAIMNADVVIKSPGVCLYQPLLEKEKQRGLLITSLLNIWCAENPKARILAITGTKGKSTTCALLQHVLDALGKRSVLLGNIGVPVTEATQDDAEYFVIEVSSYQAANFTGQCEVGVMSSLFPEHIDWHGSEAHYYRDKANLLLHSTHQIVEKNAHVTLSKLNASFDGNSMDLFDNTQTKTGNEYLDRPYNTGNVNAVLAVIKILGLDKIPALLAMKNFIGLPHRQQEIIKCDGILYVDDSISTTPQSAIAALETYKNREVTLIAGGYDRGVDYAPLVAYIIHNKVHAVVTMGECGKVIHKALKEQGIEKSFQVSSMQEAVDTARQQTIRGGVILLSPAASSFDMFKDYIARAQAFVTAI